MNKYGNCRGTKTLEKREDDQKVNITALTLFETVRTRPLLYYNRSRKSVEDRRMYALATHTWLK